MENKTGDGLEVLVKTSHSILDKLKTAGEGLWSSSIQCCSNQTWSWWKPECPFSGQVDLQKSWLGKKTEKLALTTEAIF